MKIEICIPPAGESVTEAFIAQILKPNGSYVHKEEEILEIETDKVNQVLHAPASGVLTLLVNVGDSVKINQVIGNVDASQTAHMVPPPTPREEPKKDLPIPSTTTSLPEISPSPSGKSARLGVDEYLRHCDKPEIPSMPKSAQTDEKTQGETIRKHMSSLRKTIASRLVEVKNTTAMLTTFNEVDMTQIMAIRAKEKDDFEKKYQVKLGFLSFFVKAVVAGLKEYPDIHAMIDGDDVIYHKHMHIGIAVSTDKGLFVPVVKNCESMQFADIESAVGIYAKKARDGKISMQDMQGGSFTITNGGVFGSLLSTPILNPPQSAILGMHKIQKRVVVVDDQMVIRPMMYLALSYDHRIVDGKEAVGFLVHVKESLEDPARLLLEV